MSFYTDKVKAYRLIDKLIMENTREDLIFFKIQTTFGFSEKFIKDRINLIRSIQNE